MGDIYYKDLKEAVIIAASLRLSSIVSEFI